MQRDELQEFVDNPDETLQTEYKSWLDIENNTEARADLARHMAALTNFGGGRIVVGFTDAMVSAGASPFPGVVYNRDTVSSIIKRYLEPPFQCNVRTVPSKLNIEHPIIIVPPHGATPICARASGPMVKGRPHGIVQGTYYTRKPGPESAPILTSAEWGPIIRRCSMHERGAILAAIDTALRGPITQAPSQEEALKIWHDAAEKAFQRELSKRTEFSEFAKSHWQASYAIERGNEQNLEIGRLIRILDEINNETQDLVNNTGWSMFHIFRRPGIEPGFATDPEAGQADEDFVECALIRDPERRDVSGLGLDMWRVAADGKATLIREYWEDRPDFSRQLKTAPGTWLSPYWMARSVAEFVRHSRGLAERFDAPTAVSFRMEWHGLSGRRFDDPRQPWPERGIARADSRVVTGIFPVTMLTSGWPEIVAKLINPLVRLFSNNIVITPDWVLTQSRAWRR